MCQGEVEAFGSNCRCSVKRKLEMVTGLQAPWKSQRVLRQVPAALKRTQSRFSWSKNMTTEQRDIHRQTGFATSLKGQKGAAQEIIRANVSFCFAAHLLFMCSLQIQRSHMAVMTWRINCISEQEPGYNLCAICMTMYRNMCSKNMRIQLGNNKYIFSDRVLGISDNDI